jgi:hypothetical protein
MDQAWPSQRQTSRSDIIGDHALTKSDIIYSEIKIDTQTVKEHTT